MDYAALRTELDLQSASTCPAVNAQSVVSGPVAIERRVRKRFSTLRAPLRTIGVLRQPLVNARMLGRRHHHQILRPVIQLDVIEMVNVLVRAKFSAERLLDHAPMLFVKPVRVMQDAIARRVNGAGPLFGFRDDRGVSMIDPSVVVLDAQRAGQRRTIAPIHRTDRGLSGHQGLVRISMPFPPVVVHGAPPMCQYTPDTILDRADTIRRDGFASKTSVVGIAYPQTANGTGAPIHRTLLIHATPLAVWITQHFTMGSTRAV
jgi:hypothetical protein